jgi:hypothetical protein
MVSGGPITQNMPKMAAIYYSKTWRCDLGLPKTQEQ